MRVLLCSQISGLPFITAGKVTIKGKTPSATGSLVFEDTPATGTSALRWSIEPKANDAQGAGYATLVFASDADSATGQDDLSVQAYVRSKGAAVGKANGEVVSDSVGGACRSTCLPEPIKGKKGMP